MAVELLLEKLKPLLLHHSPLFSDEAETLEKLLRLFKALPKHSTDDDELLRELVRPIRLAVYEVEDAIEAYAIHKSPVDGPDPVSIVRTTVEKVEALVDHIVRRLESEEKLRTDSDESDVELRETDDDSDAEYGETVESILQEVEHPVRERNAEVGIKHAVETLSTRLMEESTELEALSIVGMGGMGKTILAQRIFHDALIAYHFPIRIWVYVSKTFTPKEIFLHIIKEFTLLTDDINSKNDKELADLVVGFLENERFLLVMDDLWSPEDWDKLKIALPMSNKMSRVLITSRMKKVGWHANPNRGPYMMRFLSRDESWELLLLEAFRGQELPRELAYLGRVIAQQCEGLPIKIMLVAGIHFKELSSDIRTTKAAWIKVSEKLSSIIINGDRKSNALDIISMSYGTLPHHLRECFLYFGMFPEDFEIPIWKLIRLWIAEGFIQHKTDVILEETAKNYLQELIDRNLVRGVKFKLNGEVKTCRVHDFVLDFCIAEAARDGFFQQIRMSDDGDFRPPVHEELDFHRLCIHSDVLKFNSVKPNGPSVRSFVCFSREEIDQPMKDLSTIPKGFKQLRVLDVEHINFNLKLPRDLFQLLRLRYLFLSVKFNVLPSAFSQLLNIQTLVFDTSKRTLEIRADILNLTQLRHFKTKASAALPDTSTSGVTATGGESFQTLGNISPESCTRNFFERAHNLRKLGVRGNLALLLDVEKESFDSLGKLENLEKLKLLNDVYPIPPSGLPVLSLPPPNKFPPNLKILTLSRTSLQWRYMSIIGSLANLEVLKLDNKAFVGEVWEVSDGGFCSLKVLRIERMNLKIWIASDNQFPRLEHLQLRYCVDLEKIPVALADVRNFQKMELLHCKRAAASAWEIGTKIKQDYAAREFDISISPFQ